MQSGILCGNGKACVEAVYKITQKLIGFFNRVNLKKPENERHPLATPMQSSEVTCKTTLQAFPCGMAVVYGRQHLRRIAGGGVAVPE